MALRSGQDASHRAGKPSGNTRTSTPASCGTCGRARPTLGEKSVVAMVTSCPRRASACAISTHAFAGPPDAGARSPITWRMRMELKVAKTRGHEGRNETTISRPPAPWYRAAGPGFLHRRYDCLLYQLINVL